MSFDLKRVLQALLFSASDPLPVKTLQGVFTRFHEEKARDERRSKPSGDPDADAGTEALEEAAEPWPDDVPALVTATQIREAIDSLREELAAQNAVWDIRESHDGYRLAVRPADALWVKLLRNEPREIKLSQAALETLAIIAYRQPTTRAEIETIRGVSADGAINRLLDRDLIQPMGRADLPGRPLQFGTTDAFLAFVGLQSLDELPSSDVLSPKEVDAWIVRASRQSSMSDKDMGLSEEGGDDASSPPPSPTPETPSDPSQPANSHE